MKRFVLTVTALLVLASHAFAAYDGPFPSPLTPQYDRTDGSTSVRVRLTTQTKVLKGGYAHFLATINVPAAQVTAAGQTFVLEVWRVVGGGDVLLDNSCTHTTAAGEVNTALVFNCDFFQLLPGTISGFVQLYPIVNRNPGAIPLHNGAVNVVTIPVVGDDVFEPNPTALSAATITPTAGSPVVQTDLVQGASLDLDDYYKFTAPGGSGSADIKIDFWNDANDLDLFIFDSVGTQIGGSQTSNDGEEVVVSITPGQTYYIDVTTQSTQPMFYDLTVTVAGAHTLTTVPSANPTTVASGGAIALNANAADSLGHSLTYQWGHVTASCPSDARGTFSDLSSPTPTWTAPVNQSGSPKTCRLRVTVTDGFVSAVQGDVVVTIASVVHGLTLSSGPSGAPNPAPSGASVALSVTANDTLGHAVSYSWSASCPTLGNGSFSNAAAQNPTWTAPTNSSGAAETCTISVTANDGQGLTAPGSFSESILPASALTYNYYFAEGATVNHFFKTRFSLLNPDQGTAATVSVEFQTSNAGVLTHAVNVPAHSRVTLDVNTLAATVPALALLDNAEFSTVFHSDRLLVADRTMTWDNQGYGSTGETSVQSPASLWYLAEGATIGGFDLYYLIQNPNTDALNNEITVTYLLPPGQAPIVRTYSMPPKSRMNIYVNGEPGLANKEVSAIISTPAGKPVIVERSMYLSGGGLFWAAGHESAGIQAPATHWFFAEGATGDFFDEFLLVGNPNDATANITTTYLFDDGTVCLKNDQVAGKSRFNIWVDAVVIPGCARSLANAAVSATIASDIPVVAERTMWWPGPTAASWTEAHNAAGATTTGTVWGLADGEEGGASDTTTYILVANTSAYTGTARVTLYFEDGTTAVRDITLPANSRTNVPVRDASAGFGSSVTNKRFGSIIESLAVNGQSGPAQIVVERAMYSNGPGAAFWAAGTDVLATKLQ